MNYLIAVKNVLLDPALEIDGVGLELGFVPLTCTSGEPCSRSHPIVCPKHLVPRLPWALKFFFQMFWGGRSYSPGAGCDEAAHSLAVTVVTGSPRSRGGRTV